MAKKATIKDIQYALEYGGEKLLRTHLIGKPPVWTLSLTGTPVTNSIAQEIMNTGKLEIADAGLFNAPQSYRWKK